MTSNISVVYVDFSEVTLTDGKYLTELTWIVEAIVDQNLVPHHYFMDYPGAKASERALTQVVGGTPLVRYSPLTVLKTFFNDIPARALIAFKDIATKKRFKEYLSEGEVEKHIPTSYRTLCIYDDVVMDDSEAAFIADMIADTKTEAAKKFGNAL